MISAVVVFFLSLTFLVLSSDIAVKTAVRFARSLMMSPLVIGATIVALGTSLPELSVTITSILQKKNDISLGNVIGSNIVNMGLVLGMSILLGRVRVGTTKTQRNNIFLIVSVVLFISLQAFPFEIRKAFAPLLLIVSIIFIVLEVTWGKEGSIKEDFKMFIHIHEKKLTFIDGVKLLSALIVLVISSEFLIKSAVRISSFMGLTEEIVGLTFIAIGTSLPELSVSIFAAIKKEEKLLLGNIIGSNILNISLLGAAPTMLSNVRTPIHFISLATLFVITAITFIMLSEYKGRYIHKSYGFILVFSYIAYVFLLYNFRSI